MSWVTPLSLPVVQPYRGKSTKLVPMKVQHVLTEDNERRQEDDIAFAAVHDSYWTHACSVEIMNRRLREELPIGCQAYP
ncbi:unnamed protein product [Peronospora belbahrii]|uniref:DNA-directed RNA polymerase n=1 Tax=Peronospora belbahrii TaxID=622444 RepID=A0ABN8DAX9_9STRA|nr:unnamed protein product [Peronospora belbahrii]